MENTAEQFSSGSKTRDYMHRDGAAHWRIYNQFGVYTRPRIVPAVRPSVNRSLVNCAVLVLLAGTTAERLYFV
jgi:hypothetical protein